MIDAEPSPSGRSGTLRWTHTSDTLAANQSDTRWQTRRSQPLRLLSPCGKIATTVAPSERNSPSDPPGETAYRRTLGTWQSRSHPHDEEGGARGSTPAATRPDCIKGGKLRLLERRRVEPDGNDLGDNFAAKPDREWQTRRTTMRQSSVKELRQVVTNPQDSWMTRHSKPRRSRTATPCNLRESCLPASYLTPPVAQRIFIFDFDFLENRKW